MNDLIIQKKHCSAVIHVESPAHFPEDGFKTFLKSIHYPVLLISRRCNVNLQQKLRQLRGKYPDDFITWATYFTQAYCKPCVQWYVVLGNRTNRGEQKSQFSELRHHTIDCCLKIRQLCNTRAHIIQGDELDNLTLSYTSASFFVQANKRYVSISELYDFWRSHGR